MRVVLMYDFGICHRGKYADRPLLQSMILAIVIKETKYRDVRSASNRLTA
jgi:hypothetical protein